MSVREAHVYGETPSDFQLGDRVEAHPACDCWMMGDRLGTVQAVGRRLVRVRMDVSQKTRAFEAPNLRKLPSW